MPWGHSQAQWNIAKRQAREVMIARAEMRDVISYTDLTLAIKAIRFRPEEAALHALLGEISTDEYSVGRGMLSVLVVHKDGDLEPGRGFYELARQLGRLKGNDLEKFWIEELRFVHDEWA